MSPMCGFLPLLAEREPRPEQALGDRRAKRCAQLKRYVVRLRIATLTRERSLARVWPECDSRSFWRRTPQERSGVYRPIGARKYGTLSNGTCVTSLPG